MDHSFAPMPSSLRRAEKKDRTSLWQRFVVVPSWRWFLVGLCPIAQTHHRLPLPAGCVHGFHVRLLLCFRRVLRVYVLYPSAEKSSSLGLKLQLHVGMGMGRSS